RARAPPRSTARRKAAREFRRRVPAPAAVRERALSESKGLSECQRNERSRFSRRRGWHHARQLATVDFMASRGLAHVVSAPDAILIAGPTASGKSAVALALAQEHGGTIINADSMQVYRDLRVITARPTPAEEARVPHLLYGHVDAAENYSVGRWCVDVSAALAAVKRSERLPIVVGGIVLYFKALTRGLTAVPPIPPEIRAHVRERLDAEGIAPLYAELSERDPATTQRLMPKDRARVTRALEVILATG